MRDDSKWLLELVEVSKSYASPLAPQMTEPVRVLDGVNLRLGAGQSVAIVGPSGSGKSTLLNIIGGLDRPSHGNVLLAGDDLAGMTPTQLSVVRNRKIGFVFQMHHLLPQCNVLENVLLPTLACKPANSGNVQARARMLLERVGLLDRMEHRPGQLSVGQCQRVAVARALINQPEILLADEPTGSLDRDSCQGLSSLLTELNLQEQLAMVVVTHSSQLASKMGTVMQLSNGLLSEVKQ